MKQFCKSLCGVAILFVFIPAGCTSSNLNQGDQAETQSATKRDAPLNYKAPPQSAVVTKASTPAVTSEFRREQGVTEARAEPRIATPFPGVAVHVNGKHIELDGVVCIDAGWLEFIACSPRTKEHESLIVLEQRPSDIHAAMLLAGFESGSPGMWMYENEQFELIAPTGSALRIDVRYVDADGETREHSICEWILDHLGRHDFPCAAWVFGGSEFESNHPDVGGEHYVADMTGSVIGLATFGDEMIGYSEVISHDSSVQAPEWEAHTRRLPPKGTKVTLIIRSAQ